MTDGRISGPAAGKSPAGMHGEPNDGVLCVGTVSFDRVALVERSPGPDERLEADDLVSVVGGPAYVAAVTLAKLGVDVAFVGAVGDDEDGERIRAGMEADGVSPEHLVQVAGHRSAGSVITVDRGQGTRAIVHRRGPTIDTFSARMLPEPARFRWWHADHHGWGTVVAMTTHVPERQPRISLDAGYLTGDEARLGDVSLYAPPESTLLARYPGMTTRQALTSAHAEGAEIAVATRGSRGSAGYSEATGYVEAHGYSANVVSTLGAGDVFHGALLAALLRDMSLTDALRWANIAAALSCRTLDAPSGVPAAAELDERSAACSTASVTPNNSVT